VIPIVGFGAGSHCRSLIDAIQSAGVYEVVAVGDDDPGMFGQTVRGVPIVAFHELAVLAGHAFVGVGGITDSGPRTRAFQSLTLAGFRLPAVIHSRAAVCDQATIEDGAQILVGAIVNDTAHIGVGAIINSGAIVEHDCRIGDHTHVAPGAVFGGNVTVGDGCHIGLGATIREGLTIGDQALIAAGAVVLHDVPAGEWVCGVPAHEMRRAA
jgi:sugar O-acyltransferase (sialic acid O-acetyltransferase NeuD family)